MSAGIKHQKGRAPPPSGDRPGLGGGVSISIDYVVSPAPGGSSPAVGTYYDASGVRLDCQEDAPRTNAWFIDTWQVG